MMKIGSLVILSLLLNALQASVLEKPHIVYILADDLGLGDLSCYNSDSKIKTKHLDRMASSGMRFTDAHSGSSVCTPTRYGILTGRYSWRTTLKGRVLNAYSPCLIPKDRDTVPALLKRHGYQTAMIGKWHLGLGWSPKPGLDEITSEEDVDFSKPIHHGPLDLGFDTWYGPAASWDMAPYAFIENRHLESKDLVTTTSDPIYPMPAAYIQAKKEGSTGDTLKAILQDYPKTTWRKGYMQKGMKATDAMPLITQRTVETIAKSDIDQPMFIYMPLTAPHTPVVPNKPFLGKSRAGNYGDFVLEVDWAVGQVIDALKKKGIYDNTVLIFTADNGASSKAIPNAIIEKYQHQPHMHFSGSKGRVTEAGHRVPFLLSWPAVVKPGVVSDAVISTNDLYATCAEWMDEVILDHRGEDSESMHAILVGEKPLKRELVHQSFPGDLSFRSGDWKISYLNTPNKTNLVNLKTDPKEEHNLIEQNPVKFMELKKRFKAVILEGRSTEGVPQKNEGPRVWEQIRWIEEGPLE